MHRLPLTYLGVIVSFFLMFFVLDVMAQTEGICGRTPEVWKEILTEIEGQNNCADVTADQLESVTSLRLWGAEGKIESLESNDFAGLPNLKSLEISYHPDLSDLPVNIFNSLPLEWLTVSNNDGLTTLHEDLFDGLDELNNLYLDNNSFAELPQEIFHGLGRLKQLSLDRNPFETLPENIFAGLTHLNRLDLFDNSLETLHETIFADLRRLKELFLHRNSLKTLPENIFDGVETDQFILRLTYNPIECLPQKILNLARDGKIDLYPRYTPCAIPKPIVRLKLELPIIMEETEESTTVTAYLSEELSQETTIEVSVDPVSSTDYTLSSNVKLAIAAGETESTGEVTITAVDNDVYSGDRIFQVGGTATSTEEVTGPEDVTLTITDDEVVPTATLTVEPTEVNEDAGSTVVTVIATWDVVRDLDTELTISVEPGTANLGIDFEPVPPVSLTILANETVGTETFSFKPVWDNVDEPRETVLVMGNSDLGAATPATLWLTNVDPPPKVALELSPPSIPESGGETTVTARLDAASSAETTIIISAAAIYPSINSDYRLSTNPTLKIAAGETISMGVVKIAALNNDLDEPNKIVTVSGQAMNADGVTDPEDVTLTITDDDKAMIVTLTVVPPEVREDIGSEVITVTATLDVARSTHTDLRISAESGTAISGEDFIALPSIPLTIPAKEKEGTWTFTLTPIADNLEEPDEEFKIIGSTLVEGLQVSPATLKLIDAAPMPEVTLILTPEAISEAGSRTQVTASLSPSSSEETVIEVSVLPNSPATTNDYTLSPNVTLTIAPGRSESTGEVMITAVDNNIFSSEDKKVTVRGQVTNRQDVTDPSDVILTILDDDEFTGVTLNVEPPEVNEGNKTTEITVTATLEALGSEDVELIVSVADGSAVAGDDYHAVRPFELTIQALDLTGSSTFDLTPVDDFVYESPETILITAESPAVGPGKAGTYLTILDNDELITLSIQNIVVPEEMETVQVPVEVSPAPPRDLTIPFQTFELDAKEGEDYLISQNFFLIPAGKTEAFLNIQIVDDPIMESAETFEIQLSEVEGTVLDPGEAVVTIEDNDLYELRVEDDSELEHELELSFTVTLDPPHPTETVTVEYETMDGTALATVDYEPQSRTLEFPSGTSSREVIVRIIDDEEQESPETFFLQLFEPRHAVLIETDAKAIGTILDDDAPPIANLAPSVTVREDEGIARFEVILTHSLPGRQTEINFDFTDGTAEASLDYRMITESPLIFPLGQTVEFIEVEILDDEFYEDDETYQIQLTGINHGDLGQSVGQGIIIDDEDPVTVSILDVEVTESIGEAVFPVILSGQDSRERTFTFTTIDETAIAGEDYEAIESEITFPSGTVRQDIFVSIINDLETESTETFRVRLSGDGLSDGEAQGTIQDDDAPLTVSIYDERASEGDGSLLLPVRLNRPSSQLITVQFASSDETAEDGSDYVSSQGIVIFERGSTEGKIRIQILEDSEVESEEAFRVTLSSARHAVIAKSIGTGTILDNDGSPGVSVRGVTVSNHAASFDVSLSMPSQVPVLVSYTTEDGSAYAGEDYEPITGQITFAPGELSKNIEVKLLSNERIWEAKTFSLVLLSALNADIQQTRTEAVIEEESEESILKFYVSRVLRTWASQVVDGLSRRMEGMAQCRVPDLSWLQYRTERRSLGQIFGRCGTQYTHGGWSIWGQGAFTRMNGRDGALSLRSDVSTMLVGADYVWSQGWMAGLLAAHSWDQGTYDTPTESAPASSRFTGFYPYVSFQTGAGSQAWMLLGLGRGDTELKTIESGIDATLVAALVALGLTGTLTGSTTLRLGYEVDAFWAIADGEYGSDLGVRRIRAGVEGSLRLGSGMEPYIEAALRQDGGDAETGMGMELGGGVRWLRSRLHAEFRGRTLVLHTDEGVQEWGVMGSIEYGNPGGLGPSMRVQPLWGNVYGGNLWREAPLHSMSLASSNQRVEMELGYGTPIRKSLGQSIVGMTIDPNMRAYRVGYNLRLSQGFQFSVATTARTTEANWTPHSYGLAARLDLRW